MSDQHEDGSVWSVVCGLVKRYPHKTMAIEMILSAFRIHPEWNEQVLRSAADEMYRRALHSVGRKGVRAGRTLFKADGQPVAQVPSTGPITGIDRSQYATIAFNAMKYAVPHVGKTIEQVSVAEVEHSIEAINDSIRSFGDTRSFLNSLLAEVKKRNKKAAPDTLISNVLKPQTIDRLYRKHIVGIAVSGQRMVQPTPEPANDAVVVESTEQSFVEPISHPPEDTIARWASGEPIVIEDTPTNTRPWLP